MDSSVAIDSGWVAQLKKVLPVALTLSAVGAIALRLAYAPPSASAMLVSVALLTVFGAALLASIAGFAFSAIAAAVLIHVYHDPAEMVRTLLVCSIAIQVYCSARLARSVRWRELAPYLVGGVMTAPLGILILDRVPAHTYTLILGTLLLVYAAIAWLQPLRLRVHSHPALDLCVGALGGITGGLAAFPGAFPVAWCSARGLPKERQRALCQPYILVVQIVALAWLQRTRAGESQTVTELWAFIPVALLGAHFGYSIFQRISTERFRTIVLGLLGVSGALLIVTTR